MSLDWNEDDPTSFEETNLARFLADLRRKIEGLTQETQQARAMSEQWHKAKARQSVGSPIWRDVCPACIGHGRVTDIDGPSRFNRVCPWCYGEGQVTAMHERKATR